jgi:hypothetical protein
MGTTGASGFHLFLPMAVLFCRLAHSTETLGRPDTASPSPIRGAERRHGRRHHQPRHRPAWPLLGTMLLACFVRKACAGASVTVTDLFAQVTAAVSVGAALLITHSAFVTVTDLFAQEPLGLETHSRLVLLLSLYCAT